MMRLQRRSIGRTLEEPETSVHHQSARLAVITLRALKIVGPDQSCPESAAGLDPGICSKHEYEFKMNAHAAAMIHSIHLAVHDQPLYLDINTILGVPA